MIRIPKNEPRTVEQLTRHYEVEKALAQRLMLATRDERRTLYTALYNELYRLLPDHSQLVQKADGAAQAHAVEAQMRFLHPFLRPDSSFVEIGPGDCGVSLEVARRVRAVYAIDASDDITRLSHAPENFQLVISDGCIIPLPDSSVDIVYSHHLGEHLHPDDFLEQTAEVHRVLAPGGIYICVIPNRINGPHDISRYFSSVAEGLHLREYAAYELAEIFQGAGFSGIRSYVRSRKLFFPFPLSVITLVERMLAGIPHGMRMKVCRLYAVRKLLEARLVATK